MSSEEGLGTVPLSAPSIDVDKLLDYMKKLDGVQYVIISREGLPVYIEGSVSRDEAEALAALGEEALQRIESSFEKVGAGRVTKISLDVAKGRLYISRLDGGVAIYQAQPKLSDLLAETIERLKEGRSVKCQACGADLTLATYKCPRCGRTVPFTARECPHCGANIDIKRCPQCGTPIHSDGTVVKPPKELTLLGIGAGGVLVIIGAAAIAMGVATAGLVAIPAGIVIAGLAHILSKRL